MITAWQSRNIMFAKPLSSHAFISLISLDLYGAGLLNGLLRTSFHHPVLGCVWINSEFETVLINCALTFRLRGGEYVNLTHLYMEWMPDGSVLFELYITQPLYGHIFSLGK